MLILGSELHRSHRAFQFIESSLVFSFRMQEIADAAVVITIDAERNNAFGLGDRGKVEMLPTPLLDQMANKIVRVQTLHHHNDRAFGFVVKHSIKGCR